MNTSTLEEERLRLKEFSFPANKNKGPDVLERLRKPDVEPSVSRHRKLSKENTQFNPGLFQELSHYKMIPKGHHRRTLRGTKSSSPRRRMNDVRNSVSPLRDWRVENTVFPSVLQEEYAYQSPKETINHFNEQIEMNRKRRYGSLTEYANDNKLDISDKIFADCEEPKIDLEQGLAEALRATSIR